MAWQIEIGEDAEKELGKMDRQHARRIVRFLRERVAALDNPRSIGEALKGSDLGSFGNTEWGITALFPKLRTVK